MASNNKKIKTSDSSRDANAKIPTVTAKKDKEELDMNSMTEEDLKLLQTKGKQTRWCCRSYHINLCTSTATILSHSPGASYIPSYKTDPFLYNSIPGVREATFSFTEVDYPKVLQSACKVSRKTRVSFESHETVALGELLGELDGFGSEDESLGELGDLVSKLFFNTNGNSSI